MHLTRKVSFIFLILFTPLCQSADYLVDTFLTETGFMAGCQKKVKGDWYHYSCPHESGLDTPITVAETNFDYSENINFQTFIDEHGDYIHENFLVNDWEVFTSKQKDSNHSLLSICNYSRCLKIIGEYNNLFTKIISELKKTHNKPFKQDK